MRRGLSIGLLLVLGAVPAPADEGERTLYREGFEGWAESQELPHWTSSGGRWIIGREANGVLRQAQADLEGNAFTAISWTDYTVTAALQCIDHGSTWGMGLIGHWQDAAHHYRLIYNPPLLCLLKVSGREIRRLAVAPVELKAGKGYIFTLQTAGEGAGVTLRGKAWPQGAAEPPEWMLTASDLRQAFTHGPAGCWTGNAAVHFDDFKVAMPQAPGAPPGNGFVEDFETGTPGTLPWGWLTRAGDWQVAAGKSKTLQQTQSTPGIGFNGNAYAIDQGWANYTVQARIRVTENHGDWGVGLVGYWQDANHNYRLRTVADTLFLARRSGPEKTDHLQSIPLDLQPRTWYVFKLCLENGRRVTKLYGKVWPENEREPGDWLLTAEDASPNRYTAGTVGFWTLRATGSFDNLVVAPHGF